MTLREYTVVLSLATAALGAPMGIECNDHQWT